MKLLSKNDRRAFSLMELVVATGIAAVGIGGSIYAYVLSTQRAEWSAHSLAAHSLAMQRIELARAAKWDPMGYPAVDELTNTTTVNIDVLDLPVSGTNVSYATSVTTVASITANPPLKKIRVQTTWSFVNRGVYTNTIVTYRAPDQ